MQLFAERARRVRLKFKMRLFDNPYVDETAVPQKVGKPEFIAAGELAQRKSVGNPPGGLSLEAPPVSEPPGGWLFTELFSKGS